MFPFQPHFQLNARKGLRGFLTEDHGEVIFKRLASERAFSLWLVWFRSEIRLSSLITLFVTGGFLVAAHRWMQDRHDNFFDLPEKQQQFQKHQAFYGVELVHDGGEFLGGALVGI